MLWHLGNTTIRTPYRLRDALQVLQGTPLVGHLQGRDNEKAFALLLHENEVVQITEARLHQGDYGDLGRKWRAALTQLGFVSPKLSSKQEASFRNSEGESFLPFTITENGQRLIVSGATAGQQECFLRSFLAYQIPSVLEKNYHTEPFVPLKFVVDVFFELSSLRADSYLSFDEFALCIQTNTPEYGVSNVAQTIIELRDQRNQNKGSIRALMNSRYENAAKLVNRKAATLKDYADCSLRYLKATGLFRSKGRGIVLNAAQQELTALIHEQSIELLDDYHYLSRLRRGALLPTDEEGAAIRVIRSLVNQIKEKGGTISDIDLSSSNEAELNAIRHNLEEQIRFLEEKEYANQQVNEVSEIIAWLDAFVKKESISLPSGKKIAVPQGEAPAYFEWIIWRTFLAINSLTNQPWEARRFNIDQDFLPINHAPGGGPDMVFEFEDTVIVVEVTLTRSSRQEAAEGEPVRRHVASYVEQFEGIKRVYGLFLALNVDTNTAHTFRYGDWYLKDDRKINLNIVPVALEDFRIFFSNGQSDIKSLATQLKDLLLMCRAEANRDAPLWKKEISKIIQSYSKS